ncbi:MAG: Hsp20/alpha crystallin family protein [Bryobacteraceae bacterium]
MKPGEFRIFFGAATAAASESAWRPAVDVYSTRAGGWVLKFELPGVRPQDVAVAVQGCRVSVSGVRRDWLVEEGCEYQSMEIAYDRFERAVELPYELDSVTWTLEFRHGLLLVRLNPTKGAWP